MFIHFWDYAASIVIACKDRVLSAIFSKGIGISNKKEKKKEKKNQNFFRKTLRSNLKVGKHIEYMRQKLSKNMLIVKFHPGMKCL